MSNADRNGQRSLEALEAARKPFTVGDETALRDSLKRCSPATIEAAIAYRQTDEASHLPAVIIGVIERFVEADLRSKLKQADDELRLVEDLGIDSLTMMEIVILVEDVLQMQINNEDLRNLRTLGNIKVFIDCKARGLPPPSATKFLPIEQIISLMPIQSPFLFLNEATIGGNGAQGKYKITGQEFFLQGPSRIIRSCQLRSCWKRWDSSPCYIYSKASRRKRVKRSIKPRYSFPHAKECVATEFVVRAIYFHFQ